MVLSARAMGHLFSYLSDEVDGGLRQAYALATHLLDALLSISAEAWVTHESPRHWHGTRREIMATSVDRTALFQRAWECTRCRSLTCG